MPTLRTVTETLIPFKSLPVVRKEVEMQTFILILLNLIISSTTLLKLLAYFEYVLHSICYSINCT